MLGLSYIVAEREVKDALSDWRIITPMLVLAVLFPMLVVGGISIGVPLMDRIDPLAATEKLVPFGAMMVGFFPISFSLVIALESFVGEKERNTLEALLAMPLSDAELFAGKLMAVLVPPLALSLVALTIYSVGLHFILDFHIAPDFVLLSILLSIVEALVMVAGAVVISSHTTSVRAANLLASFIILPMALALQGELLLIITGYGQALWFVLVELLVISAILVRMGVTVFNREEILARENDRISIRSVGSKLWHFLIEPPHLQHETAGMKAGRLGLRRLYLLDFPVLLRSSWQPALVASGVVVVGGVLGYVLALVNPLPVPAGGLPDLAASERTLESMASLSTLGVFVHNVRALAIAALLSVFTFGSASLLLLLVPVGLAGFFTGQASSLGMNPLAFAAAFFAPHGIVEIPAAVIATAFSLRLGMSLMCPPKGFTFGESLLLAVANWVKVMVALLPLLLIAAYIEANLTPLIADWLLGGK